MKYSAEEKIILRNLGMQSIRHGVAMGEPISPIPTDIPLALHEPRACFVTLMKQGELRGCIGSLEPSQPLFLDVAKNAFQAAFHDPRFSPVTEGELHHLEIKISVLSPPEFFPVKDEEDLLKQIRPFKDGLILEEGRKRGTFLPSVWESLPDPKEFLMHLKRKAGFALDYWSNHITVRRYTTEDF